MTQVFDFEALERRLREDPAEALHELVEAVGQQQLQVRFRSAMPIAGPPGAKHDIVRLTLDVDVQLVRLTPAAKELR